MPAAASRGKALLVEFFFCGLNFWGGRNVVLTSLPEDAIFLAACR
jgi:hypothetical protein